MKEMEAGTRSGTAKDRAYETGTAMRLWLRRTSTGAAAKIVGGGRGLGVILVRIRMVPLT